MAGHCDGRSTLLPDLLHTVRNQNLRIGSG
jgi:hypothetical protein